MTIVGYDGALHGRFACLRFPYEDCAGPGCLSRVDSMPWVEVPFETLLCCHVDGRFDRVSPRLRGRRAAERPSAERKSLKPKGQSGRRDGARTRRAHSGRTSHTLHELTLLSREVTRSYIGTQMNGDTKHVRATPHTEYSTRYRTRYNTGKVGSNLRRS